MFARSIGKTNWWTVLNFNYMLLWLIVWKNINGLALSFHFRNWKFSTCTFINFFHLFSFLANSSSTRVWLFAKVPVALVPEYHKYTLSSFLAVSSYKIRNLIWCTLMRCSFPRSIMPKNILFKAVQERYTEFRSEKVFSILLTSRIKANLFTYLTFVDAWLVISNFWASIERKWSYKCASKTEKNCSNYNSTYKLNINIW